MKQQEMKREVGQARLLRETGVSSANLLAHVAESFCNLLAKRRARLHNYLSRGQKSYKRQARIAITYGDALKVQGGAVPDISPGVYIHILSAVAGLSV